MDKVSAVLINWKRPRELEKIMENLRTYDFIDDIIVVDNAAGVNKQVWGRYCGTRIAKHDVIYTQDDDCIVHNIKEIYDSFDGEHLSNGLKKEAMLSYRDRNHTLVGWGAFFKKEWVSVFDQYLDKYPEDNILYTNADRIFTALLPRPYNTIEANVIDFPTATSDVAMAHQASFFTDTEIAMERIASL